MATGLAAREGKATRRMVWMASALALLTDIGYVVLIRRQALSPLDSFAVPFLVAYIGLTAAMLALSLSEQQSLVRMRPPLRAAAAAGLLVLGALALMSIGLLLLVAGALATGAALRTLAVAPGARTVLAEAVAAVTVVVILVAGLEVMARIIECPPQGISGGIGGLVTSFSWQCNDGHLELRSGS